MVSGEGEVKARARDRVRVRGGCSPGPRRKATARWGRRAAPTTPACDPRSGPSVTHLVRVRVRVRVKGRGRVRVGVDLAGV